MRNSIIAVLIVALLVMAGCSTDDSNATNEVPTELPTNTAEPLGGIEPDEETTTTTVTGGPQGTCIHQPTELWENDAGTFIAAEDNGYRYEYFVIFPGIDRLDFDPEFWVETTEDGSQVRTYFEGEVTEASQVTIVTVTRDGEFIESGILYGPLVLCPGVAVSDDFFKVVGQPPLIA